jgi:hypothetical protein
MNSSHGRVTDAKMLTPNERRKIALNGTPLQRAEFIKTITIPYPQFMDGLNLLEDAFNRSHSIDPGGVRIIGASGLGKSFICQHFLQSHPTSITDDQVTIPVLYLQLEASLSALDLVRRMLIALGFPFRTNKNRVDLTDLLAEGMEHRHVAFVLIDEAQEFAEGRGESRASVIGNTLKRIYDKTGRPHGYMGTELLERFFAINGQLAGRIAACHKLAPLAYDDIYFGVLKAFDEALPMQEVSDLCAVFAEPIYQSTNGNLRALRRLLSASVICASHDEAKQLTWRHFAVAYQQVFGTGLNPFAKK